MSLSIRSMPEPTSQERGFKVQQGKMWWLNKCRMGGKKGEIKGPSFRKWKNKVLHWKRCKTFQDGVKMFGRKRVVYLTPFVLIGSKSQWSVLSPFSPKLKNVALPFPLASASPLVYFIIPFFFSSWHFCAIALSQTGSKLQTRQGSKWKEMLSVCRARHFLANLIYFSGHGFLPGMLQLLSSNVHGRVGNVGINRI